MTHFEKLLNSHLDELFSFAQSKIKNPQLAADVVQDSLMKALKNQDSVKKEKSIRAWLYQILRNTINDLYRKNYHNPIDQAEMDTFASAEELDHLACRCIEKLLPSLNDDYAFMIRELELKQQPVQKIANTLGINENNLKVKRFRARKQLKQRLEETCRICAKHGCLDCDCERS